MTRDRDVQAFHDRAGGYENGWRGRMHRGIVARTAELAFSVDQTPLRVLDVGCGTGLLLRLLARRLPHAQALVGIDAAPRMIEVAESTATNGRLQFRTGTAENLPFPNASFDLVVSTTSFDHWANQQTGLVECARVLRPGGHLVLTDLFSLWLAPTLIGSRRRHARTKHRANCLLTASGFHHVTWHRLYAIIIGAAVASNRGRATRKATHLTA